MTYDVITSLHGSLNACKDAANAYVVVPALSFGRGVVQVMSPRQMQSNENKIAYCAKESVVFVAKVVMIVAVAAFLKAICTYAIGFTVAGLALAAARYAHIKATKKNFENTLEKGAEVATATIDAVFAGIRRLMNLISSPTETKPPLKG